MDKVNIEIKYKNGEIINSTIYIYYKKLNIAKFKIIESLGKGTIGHVFLINKIYSDIPIFPESNYVIKISNPKCMNEMIEEIYNTYHLFEKNKIIHGYYPLLCGPIMNHENMGAIYPFVGSYNLEKVNNLQYIKDEDTNISIISQILDQMKEFKNIIHCDMKSSNIVIYNNSIATVIDFGLIRSTKNPGEIISTVYATSPESLFTTKYKDIINNEEYKMIDFSKHDYIGLFGIVIDIFVKYGLWNNLCNYVTNILSISSSTIAQLESSDIYIYIWYKFNPHQTLSDIYMKLIKEIEKRNPQLVNKPYLTFEEFFNIYITKNIYPKYDKAAISGKKLELLKNFLIKLILIDPMERPSIKELMEDPFLTC
jgi:serine/threonine protein kinase